MKSKNAVLVLLLTLVFPNNSLGEEKEQWYPVLIHVHSTFSDGSRSISEITTKAKAMGYKAVVITDHAEQINSKEKVSEKWFGKIAGSKDTNIGFDSYKVSCQREYRENEFSVIPASEFATHWKAEEDTKDQSHLLAIGIITENQEPFYKTFSKQDLTQKELIEKLYNKFTYCIAAHPSLVYSKIPWEWKRYRTDKRKIEDCLLLKGVEFFNDDTPEQEKETFNFYLLLQGKNYNYVAATSGCDSHGWEINGLDLYGQIFDDKDEERWLRATWIYSTFPQNHTILGAILDCRTYASAKGAVLRSMNRLPGYSTPIEKTEKVDFYYKIEFPDKLKKPVECSFYRDGVKVESSRMKIENKSSAIYQWTDENVSNGKHWYVFYMPGYIVTSPYILNVTK